MKSESTALVKQSETIYHAEREQTQTLNFIVGILTNLFTGFISTAARLVWDSFLELTTKLSS